jgi:hypothetical protein
MYVIDGAGELIEDALGIKVPEGREEDRRMYTRALGRLFLERYGSLDALKKTIATDPVGFMADASTAIGGEGMLLRGAEMGAKAGGLTKTAGAIGKAAKVAEKTAEFTNPADLAGKGLRGTGRAAWQVGTNTWGVATGTGGGAIRRAFETSGSRLMDPQRYEAFVKSFTQETPPAEVASYAEKAVSELRRERGQAYTREMATIKANQTPLDFRKIDDALIDEINSHTTVTNSGIRIGNSEIGDAALKDVEKVLQEFRNLPPSDFTVEIADAMKKKLGKLAEKSEYKDQFGNPNAGGVVINGVKQAVTGVITNESPEYAKVMRQYEIASDQIKEIQKELSLGRDANAGLILRKLQSGLRNNVSTAYAHRKELIEFLEENGSPYLADMLSGMALSEGTSRGGMGRLFTGLAASDVAFGGKLIGAAGLAATSPRVAGQAARAIGTAASPFVAATEMARGTRAGQLAGAGLRSYARDPQRRGRWFGPALDKALPQEPLSGEDQSELSGQKQTGVDVAVKPYTGGAFRPDLPAPATKSQMEKLPPPVTPPGGAEDTPETLGIRG